jgi:hypothetical protein
MKLKVTHTKKRGWKKGRDLRATIGDSKWRWILTKREIRIMWGYFSIVNGAYLFDF